MIRLFSVLIVLGAANLVIADEPPPRMRAAPDENGVLIVAGSSPILYYQRAAKSLDGNWPRANYVNLYGLDGNLITEDFPTDHRHHRGVFWAWHQVLVGDKQLGDSWVCKDFVWDVESVETSGEEDSKSIIATVLWKSPDHVDASGEMVPVVRERSTITAYRQQQRYRQIDFEISLLALVDDVKIGGSDDVKGYGGFSPRIKLNQQTRFVSADGDLEPVKTAIQAGRWINIADRKSGLAILSHSSNPQPNDRWILRGAKSMQNAVFPGREPVALSTEQPTVLKYRLVIHRGDLTADEISALQRDVES